MHRRTRLISVLLCSICFVFETAHAVTTAEEWVQKAYIAYYGRPGDPAGVDYWAGKLDQSGGELSSIIEAFGTSQEFTDNYGSLSNDQLIDTIYRQMFNRDPDAGGKQWYLDQLNSGAMTLQSITLNVLGGAQNEDLRIIENKLAVAAYFTEQLRVTGVTYKSISEAKLLLSLVDETAASVETAKSRCDILLASWGSGGRPGKLPDTGQVISYTDIYGEDSDYTINPPSYTKLDASCTPLDDNATSWAMVRDNVTGLIWESKTEDGSIHDKDNRYSWYDPNPETNGGDAGEDGDGTDTQDFIDALNSAAFGGFSDWRLPSLLEMRTIFHYGAHNPALDTQYFPNKPTTEFENYYWSTATHANGSAVAWFSVLYNGHCYYGSKSGTYLFVRAVRGGQAGLLADSATPGRMTDNGDETITDSTTGLMWQKQVDETPLPWEEAIANCESMTLANHNDWRMPNIKELYSIVDFGKYNPAIDTELFPNTGGTVFWSSTTFNEFIDNAWCVDFYEGYHLEGTKSDSFYVRAVRNVQQ